MKSILIIKTSAIGDVIQTFPVLEYLRFRFPDSKIHWLVEKGCSDVISSHPMVDKAIIVQTKKWRKHPFSSETRQEFSSFVSELKQVEYDYVFDLQGNTKSAFLGSFANAKEKVGYGWKTVSEKPNYFFSTKRFDCTQGVNIRTKYLQIVQQYFQDTQPFNARGGRLKTTHEEKERIQSLLASPKVNGRFVLMVAFGSNWKNKKLSEEALVTILKKISSSFPISLLFVFGNEQEKKTAEFLHNEFSPNSMVVGNMSLSMWQSLMFEVNGVFTVDSAALHLCGTTTTPSFSVFGPSFASIYKPLEVHHCAVQGICPYGKVFEKRCPALRTCSTGSCLRDLSSEYLFERFTLWYESVRDLKVDRRLHALAQPQWLP